MIVMQRTSPSLVPCCALASPPPPTRRLRSPYLGSVQREQAFPAHVLRVNCLISGSEGPIVLLIVGLSFPRCEQRHGPGKVSFVLEFARTDLKSGNRWVQISCLPFLQKFRTGSGSLHQTHQEGGNLWVNHILFRIPRV